MSNKGPRMDVWGTPMGDRILLELDDFISTFCPPFVKYDLNPSAVTP